MNIEQYLRYEGVKSFQDEKSYWNWANRAIGIKSAKQLAQAMKHRADGDADMEAEFYDFLSQPDVVPVAAGFEHALLVQIAHWVEKCLPLHGTVIELGCHTGLLTRYYASARPDLKFVGVDRSDKAIQLALKKVQEHKITNLEFVVHDLSNESLPDGMKADCILTGRVLGGLMSRILRRRNSWQDYQYPQLDPKMDLEVKRVLNHCMKMLPADGKLLVTERLSNFDRFTRLWQAFQEQGFMPETRSVTPISWQDVSGEHYTWLFQAHASVVKEESKLQIQNTPIFSKEINATVQPTRLMLDGILAWQVWNSLMNRNVTSQQTLGWEGGEIIHYEIGLTGVGLGYAYVASNTDLHLLTIFLPQETEKVKNDLKDYEHKLRSSGAQIVENPSL